MWNTVIIRATKCIYVLSMTDYKKYFKPVKRVFTEGEKHVCYECGELVFSVDEGYFNREILAHVPHGIILSALKRGKYQKRLENSYNQKGSGKHGPYPIS